MFKDGCSSQDIAIVKSLVTRNHGAFAFYTVSPKKCNILYFTNLLKHHR